VRFIQSQTSRLFSRNSFRKGPSLFSLSAIESEAIADSVLYHIVTRITVDRLRIQLWSSSAVSDYTSLVAKRHFLLASTVVIGLAGVVSACASNESRSRYRFDVVNQPVPVNAHSTITVRLTDATTGQPVDGATISDARLTMRMPSTVPPGKGISPDRSHSEEVRFVGSSGVGQYGLISDVSMPGNWTLVLSATVPGEASPVEGSTRFTASRERHDP
jgi:hypothetical protein